MDKRKGERVAGAVTADETGRVAGPQAVADNGTLAQEGRETVAPRALLRGDTPGERLVRARELAAVFKEMVEADPTSFIKQLEFKDHGRKSLHPHVKVEGWTLLGQLLDTPVTPVGTVCREIDGGFEAEAEARTLDGAVVGHAVMRCMRTERRWADNDQYALMSMAQTRAAAKALRLPFGWIATLAGYEATPAEEAEALAMRQAEEEAERQAAGGDGKPRKAKDGEKAHTATQRAYALWTGVMRDCEMDPSDQALLKASMLDAIVVMTGKVAASRADLTNDDWNLVVAQLSRDRRAWGEWLGDWKRKKAHKVEGAGLADLVEREWDGLAVSCGVLNGPASLREYLTLEHGGAQALEDLTAGQLDALHAALTSDGKRDTEAERHREGIRTFLLGLAAAADTEKRGATA